MRIGLGLRGKSLTPSNMAFAAQLGCSDIVVTLFEIESLPPSCSKHLRDETDRYVVSRPEMWSVEYLSSIKKAAAEFGLGFTTIENFSPADYYDIMLDGPRAHSQLSILKQMIANAGKAGITHIGYGYNPSGVWGRQKKREFRGGAAGLVFDEDKIDGDKPIPNGMIWNTVYDPNAPTGDIGTISIDEMWQRYTRMMSELLPVAAESGVSLCLHPSDPPLPSLRRTARIISSEQDYNKLFQIFPQQENKMVFCSGTIQEMPNTQDVVQVLANYLEENRVGYCHIRNVSGKAPLYREEFPDEGDIKMRDFFDELKRSNYDGIIMPDHTPEMDVKEPWHTGMAFAIGYIKGLLA